MRLKHDSENQVKEHLLFFMANKLWAQICGGWEEELVDASTQRR